MELHQLKSSEHLAHEDSESVYNCIMWFSKHSSINVFISQDRMMDASLTDLESHSREDFKSSSKSVIWHYPVDENGR